MDKMAECWQRPVDTDSTLNSKCQNPNVKSMSNDKNSELRCLSFGFHLKFEL
jgi:hypothetical protein